ncbi:MAG: DUF1592 domain-containing protein [Deltaproteobacteria bacterium]|nr:MAG: DUF1592 domain-containing protein [Deltaproteobacteria bacterium]
MQHRSLLLFLLAGCGQGEPDPLAERDPGTVTLHRLNRAELDNTWRDLTGTAQQPARNFPSDDSGYGFDNIADVLSTSPLHLEMLEAATDELLATEMLPGVAPARTWWVEAESGDAGIDTTAGGECCGGWMVWSNGSIGYTLDLPADGTYQLTVRAWGTQAGPDLVAMDVGLDGNVAQSFAVAPDSADNAETFTVSLQATAGAHRFFAAFTNDYVDSVTGDDRNLVVDWIEVTGPIGASTGRPANYGRLFSCEPSAGAEASCAAEIARTFGGKAWRRPLEDAEVTRLVALYQTSIDSGGSFEEAIGLMAKGILMSPHFWYRVELDADPADVTPHPLGAYELASRLSYFLWSSMPDDELFARAEDGTLLEDEVLEAQVRRMLADPKAAALVDNLAGQWLHVRAVKDAFPDVASFPDWDETLRASMEEEMRRMATRVFLGDHSMLELLTTEETEIDARLAEHYGLPAPASAWESVSLADTERSGWLTTGGLLTATSYPGRTSPVRRGKWVLSNLMCESPAPPPENVDTFFDTGDATGGQSLTEQLERHRADPVCASCHQSMDPIGLGLENFDGIGMWRNTDELGQSIDASGELPSGFTFHTPRELTGYLAEDPKFPRCIAIKTFTYGLGRPPGVHDWPYLDTIEQRFASGEHRFEDLAVAIALSEPFRSRRGEVSP